MIGVLSGNGITISASRIPWYVEFAPGILLGFIIFGILALVYLLYRLLKKSKFEKELMIRAEVAGEYEARRKEEIREKRKKTKGKKAGERPAQLQEYAAERHLKEEERQVVNILKEREGQAEQGTLRVVSGLPKSTLSRILKELEERNIIYKEKRGKKNVVFLRQ